MSKSPDAFRTISEVAEWLETPAHVLRFWESKFTQVKPVKRAGGRRYYRPADMVLLGGIKKLLHDDGMTIKGVQKMLAEQGVKAVSELSPPLETDTDAPMVPAAMRPEGKVPPARLPSSRRSTAHSATSETEVEEAPVAEDVEPEEMPGKVLPFGRRESARRASARSGAKRKDDEAKDKTAEGASSADSAPKLDGREENGPVPAFLQRSLDFGDASATEKAEDAAEKAAVGTKKPESVRSTQTSGPMTRALRTTALSPAEAAALGPHLEALRALAERMRAEG